LKSNTITETPTTHLKSKHGFMFQRRTNKVSEKKNKINPNFVAACVIGY